MNIALTLPRLFHASFLPAQSRPRGQVAQAAMPKPQAMARHAMLTLDNRPLQLRVLRGCVWITRDGCQGRPGAGRRRGVRGSSRARRCWCRRSKKWNF